MKDHRRITPPNWASTPHAEVTMRRKMPRGLPVAIAYVRSAPSTAPPTAVTADRMTLFTTAPTMYGRDRFAKLTRVGPPSLAKAPATMIAVGKKRKRPQYQRNVTAPIQSSERRRPPIIGRPTPVTAGLPAAVKKWRLPSG